MSQADNPHGANILVLGGAGYIGSHMVKRLGQAGCRVTTLDNLSKGYRDAVLHGELVVGDVDDRRLMDSLLGAQRFDVVMHFAASIEVGESVRDPAAYYRNNVGATLTLLEALRDHGVDALIFSSTAAIFGDPDYTPIDERHPAKPINAYGRSKLMVEQMLQDHHRAYGLRSICLRYFNAAGADPEGQLGERHDPETHLIPLVLQAASGRRSEIAVFGRDYDTPDGSCVRDYLHVSDICEAHWLALQALVDGHPGSAYNLGNGEGFSVQEVIDTARRVTGRLIPQRDADRRQGDPARLVADARRARDELGWHPARDDLETIIADAWRWETRNAASRTP
jgi:UDP-glucose 4-epimerase